MGRVDSSSLILPSLVSGRTTMDLRSHQPMPKLRRESSQLFFFVRQLLLLRGGRSFSETNTWSQLSPLFHSLLSHTGHDSYIRPLCYLHLPSPPSRLYLLYSNKLLQGMVPQGDDQIRVSEVVVDVVHLHGISRRGIPCPTDQDISLN